MKTPPRAASRIKRQRAIVSAGKNERIAKEGKELKAPLNADNAIPSSSELENIYTV